MPARCPAVHEFPAVWLVSSLVINAVLLSTDDTHTAFADAVGYFVIGFKIGYDRRNPIHCADTMQPWFAEFGLVGQNDDTARSLDHRAVFMGFVFQKSADARFWLNAVCTHDKGVEAHFRKCRIDQSSGDRHGFAADVAAGQHHLMLLVAKDGLRNVETAGHDDKRCKIAQMCCQSFGAGAVIEQYRGVAFKETDCLASDCILGVEIDGATINRISFHTSGHEAGRWASDKARSMRKSARPA